MRRRPPQPAALTVRIDELLTELLADGRQATVRDLLAEIRARGGHGVARAAVERTLAADARFVPAGEATKPEWRLDPDTDPEGRDAAGGTGRGERAEGRGATVGRGTRAELDALDLWTWQAEAFAAWSRTGRGVIEAVTGTGKTRLALAVIRALADREVRVLVLAPTLELQDQWVRALRPVVPDLVVGRLGGGYDDDLFACNVVVSTPHSAAAVPVDLPPGCHGLLVADEAHRYGAPTWAAALRADFTFRLALTATYERGDDGLVDVLNPYFGGVVHRYDYPRAVADGTVAPFRLALAGVALSTVEARAYAAADQRVRRLHRELIAGRGMPMEPRSLFAAVAGVVAEAERSGRVGTQVTACREYLRRVRERRDVAASAAGKLEVCRAVAPGLSGRRSLVFADTIEQAEQADRILSSAGLATAVVHGGLDRDGRRRRLAAFRSGRLEALVAPRVLDEGVDVPAADVAVVLAAFRTRRQMVQRLGRVLRLKPDGGEARLVLAHARETIEDPATGGHRDFLAQVRPVAREVRNLGVPEDAGAIADWLTRPAGRS